MLLGAARLLKAREGAMAEEGRGGVLLVFQPAEEGRGGAGEVVASGELKGVEAVFGLHGGSGVAWLAAGWLQAGSCFHSCSSTHQHPST